MYDYVPRDIWITLSVLVLAWFTCLVVTQLHRIVLLDQINKYAPGIGHIVLPNAPRTSTDEETTGVGQSSTPTQATTNAGREQRVSSVLDPMAPVCLRYMRWRWATRKLSELVILVTVLTLIIQFALFSRVSHYLNGEDDDGDGKWPNPHIPDEPGPTGLPGAVWVLFWIVLALGLLQVMVILFRHPELYFPTSSDRNYTHGYRHLGTVNSLLVTSDSPCYYCVGTSQLPVQDRMFDPFGDHSLGIGDTRVSGVIGNPVGMGKWLDAATELIKWILVLVLLILVWIRM